MISVISMIVYFAFDADTYMMCEFKVKKYTSVNCCITMNENVMDSFSRYYRPPWYDPVYICIR